MAAAGGPAPGKVPETQRPGGRSEARSSSPVGEVTPSAGPEGRRHRLETTIAGQAGRRHSPGAGGRSRGGGACRAGGSHASIAQTGPRAPGLMPAPGAVPFPAVDDRNLRGPRSMAPHRPPGPRSQPPKLNRNETRGPGTESVLVTSAPPHRFFKEGRERGQGRGAHEKRPRVTGPQAPADGTCCHAASRPASPP